MTWDLMFVIFYHEIVGMKMCLTSLYKGLVVG